MELGIYLLGFFTPIILAFIIVGLVGLFDMIYRPVKSYMLLRKAKKDKDIKMLRVFYKLGRISKEEFDSYNNPNNS